MRTISTAQDRAILSHARCDHMRVRVDSDGVGTWVDLTDLVGVDWVISATINESVDSPMKTASVTLWREWESLSLVGLMTASRVNLSSTVIDIAREIKIETATLGADSVPASGDWVEVFRGYIDDISFGGDKPVMKLMCRDQGAELADTYLETVGVYGTVGGQLVETSMQAILTAALAGGAPTLYTPASPAWSIYQYKQGKEPTLTAIRKLALQIGWDLRYRWRSGTGQYELTLYTPDRTPSVLRTFADTAYDSITQASISRKDIRNRIEVAYTDPTKAINDTDRRVSYIVEDAASIAKYGKRYAGFAEASSSNISTLAEATAMAAAALSDLKEPALSHAVDMPYFFAAELGDYYKFSANGTHYDTDQSLAVVSYSHQLGKGKPKTTLQTRGIPSAGTKRWLVAEGRPGVGPAIDDYSDAAVTAVLAPGAGGSIIVTCDDPRAAVIVVADWAYTECHVSLTPGFTPGPSTLMDSGKVTRFVVGDLFPGQLYYVKLIVIDESGNIASTSAQVSRTAAYVGPAQVNPDSSLSVSVNLNSEFSAWTSPSVQADNPPDNWKTVHIAAAGEGSEFVDDDTLWGSGDEVYFSTAIQQTGDTSIVFDATAPSEDYPGVASERFPMQAGKLYALEVNFRVADIDDSIDVRLETYEDDGSTFDNWGKFNIGAQAIDTFYEYVAYMRVSSTTKWGRLIVAAAHDDIADPADGLIYVDRMRIRESLLAFLVYVNNAQTIANTTWTQVEFDTREHDRASTMFSPALRTGDYDLTNYRLLVPEKGIYQISAKVEIANVQAGGHVQLALYVDGAAVKFGTKNINGSGGALAIGASIEIAAIDFNKGEDVDIRVYHNAGGNRDTVASADESYFSCRRIS